MALIFKRINTLFTKVGLPHSANRGLDRTWRTTFFSTQTLAEETQSNEKNEEDIVRRALEEEDYFNVSELVKMEELFAARVHLGHKEGSLDKRMKPYLFGSRLGHLVFDLDKTSKYLTRALNVAAHIAFRDGIVLFVAQSPQNSHLVEKTAKECKEFAHTRHWRLGMFTNAEMMFGVMTRLPDLVILLNTLTTVTQEHPAIAEAAKMAIPTIGIVDTNCNPNLITYPVPGNDDTPCAIELYCRLFKEAILRGKKAREDLK